MGITGKRVVIFMPARNTGHLLRQTYDDIPDAYRQEIILVDNASHDNTVEVAEGLGMRVIKHSENRGYGGSLKTGYRAAIDSGADVVLMLHSDYQYDPCLVPDMVRPLLDDRADCVLGSRLVGGKCLQGGMPWWKYVANVALTKMINLSIGGDVAEFQTGYRAFSRKCLESIPFERNSDNFLFDMQILVQIVRANLRVVAIPIPTRYMKGVSTMTFRQCVRYGFGVLRCIGGYWAFRLRLQRNRKYESIVIHPREEAARRESSS